MFSGINRASFSNIWFIYQSCLYTFFMNDIAEFEIPMLLDDLSICEFFDVNYDQWYNDFVNHWATHHQTHPCASTKQNENARCMKSLVLDGMQKVARPIYTNKTKHEITNEFPDGLYVGCRNTLESNSGLCESCKQCNYHTERYGNLSINERQQRNI